MDLSVVVAAREDDHPPTAVLAVASLADRLGFGEVWIAENPTWDTFALATAIGLGTERVTLTVGPLPVSVRDPATILRGAESVAALIGRRIGVALGTSSVRVVQGLHGRSRAGAARVLAETAAAVRARIGTDPDPAVETGVFRRRLPAAGGPLTVAAFGDRAIAAAAEHADRMLLDLVAPEQVRELRDRLDAAARRIGRTPPRLAAWLPAAVDPDPAALTQLRESIVRYLPVRGYADMLAAMGLGRAVELANAGAGPDELLDAVSDEAAGMAGLVGTTETIRERVDAYADAGLDEICVVPATAGDPAGERTLTALAGLR